MAKLNQFSISQVLQSTIATGVTPRFGGLGTLLPAGESHRMKVPSVTGGVLDKRFDKQIISAFKETAKGKAVDPVLADPDLHQQFIKKCRELGIESPSALISRRLLRIRKTGKLLPAATDTKPQPSIDAKNVFAVEFAAVRMSYLYGATVDDILCEPAIGAEFNRIAASIAPGYDPLIYRLGALYLRKTRNLVKSKRKVVNKLNLAEIQSDWVSLGTASHIKLKKMETVGPGVIEVFEDRRSLYVTSSNSVGETVETFLRPGVWSQIGGQFWTPDPSGIYFNALPEAKVDDIGDWETRLIQVHEPVFNIPVAA